MAECSMSKEALRALAESAGLNIGDDVLEELLPRIRRSAETTAELDALDLQGVEPATVFTSSSE